LNFADFSRQVTKIEKPIVDPLYFGTSPLHPASSGINRITQKLLSLRKERSPGAKVSQIQRTALESTGDSKHHDHRANDVIQKGVFPLMSRIIGRFI
jgi:hypothetical protein